jgi:DNA polymerase-3 subunit alpha
MAFVTLEDLEGSVEATCFADLWERSRSLLAAGSVVEVRGRVNLREEADPKIVLLSARAVAAPDPAVAPALHLDIDPGSSDQALGHVRALLVRHPGESPVYSTVREPSGAPATVRARRLLVDPCDALLGALRARLGAGAVRLAAPDPEAESAPGGGRDEAVAV